ncbi:GntR family transcriptional regulator [Weissella confusa]|nr:GntR family transcriptional regulator [Weissella confusa]
MIMEFNDNEPLYIQVADYLESEILDGKYEMGSKVPSVRELAAELVINGRTVQNAITRLVESGLVETRRGLGNFVTTDQEKIQRIRRNKITAMTETFVKNSLAFVSIAELQDILTQVVSQYKKG